MLQRLYDFIMDLISWLDLGAEALSRLITLAGTLDDIEDRLIDVRDLWRRRIVTELN